MVFRESSGKAAFSVRLELKRAVEIAKQRETDPSTKSYKRPLIKQERRAYLDLILMKKKAISTQSRMLVKAEGLLLLKEYFPLKS